MIVMIIKKLINCKLENIRVAYDNNKPGNVRSECDRPTAGHC